MNSKFQTFFKIEFHFRMDRNALGQRIPGAVKNRALYEIRRVTHELFSGTFYLTFERGIVTVRAVKGTPGQQRVVEKSVEMLAGVIAGSLGLLGVEVTYSEFQRAFLTTV